MSFSNPPAPLAYPPLSNAGRSAFANLFGAGASLSPSIPGRCGQILVFDEEGYALVLVQAADGVEPQRRNRHKHKFTRSPSTPEMSLQAMSLTTLPLSWHAYNPARPVISLMGGKGNAQEQCCLSPTKMSCTVDLMSPRGFVCLQPTLPKWQKVAQGAGAVTSDGSENAAGRTSVRGWASWQGSCRRCAMLLRQCRTLWTCPACVSGTPSCSVSSPPT